jgi:hypothetical protein
VERAQERETPAEEPSKNWQPNHPIKSIELPGPISELRAKLERKAKPPATSQAIKESDALIQQGDLAGAKAKLKAPGVDARDEMVRMNLATIEQKENAVRSRAQWAHVDRDLFFEVINEKIQAAQAPKLRVQFESMAIVVGGNDYLATHGRAKETFELKSLPDGTMVSEYRHPGRLPGKLLKTPDSVPARAAFYVDNDPSLASRDFTPQAVKTLSSSVWSGYEFREVAPGPMNEFRPTVVLETVADATVSYTQKSSEERTEPFGPEHGESPCAKPAEQAPLNCRPIVLVRKRPATVAR